MNLLNRSQWDTFLGHYPQAHLLQTGAWGDLKSGFGWDPVRIVNGENGAQILFRKLPLGFSAAYLPKGPVGPEPGALWSEIDELCRLHRAVFLKVEPDAWDEKDPVLSAQMAGFRPGRPIQPARTIVISLAGSEADWLERMKQKTRYNIRLAERKEVVVRAANEVNAFYDLMQVTGTRDGFGVHSRAYYVRAYEQFHAQNGCELLLAEYGGTPLAGLMVFCQGERAWYLYGASNDQERNRMPTYLLQWQAMRWAAARGCTSYDLWGIPDEDEPVLEEQFEQRSDGLWGVYRFKRGFGGRLMRAAQAWDRVYQPLLYRLYLTYTSRRGNEG
jgi:peptidoglycan pentaglycine glycine transferase (the first glycine)